MSRDLRNAPEMKKRIVTDRHEKLRGRTYDEFFDSRSPVSKVQFWGLILLGGGLMVSGAVILMMLLSALRPISFTKLIVVIISSALWILFIYFGLAHVKRAFRK
jgi:cytochrome b subunit of formate dehydrogenase